LTDTGNRLGMGLVCFVDCFRLLRKQNALALLLYFKDSVYVLSRSAS